MNRILPILGSVFAALGLLSGCCHNCCECHEQDEALEVSRAEVPAAVMATLEREAAGGTIGEIEKEMEGGRIVYTAEVIINGEEWEIEVAEDGRLLGKELEADADTETAQDVAKLVEKVAVTYPVGSTDPFDLTRQRD